MKKKLKQYLEENNLNQRQLAWLLDTDETYLSKIMTSKRQAGRQIIEKYNQLPGVREQEMINRVRAVVNNLWTDGVIDGNTAKIILKQINSGD